MPLVSDKITRHVADEDAAAAAQAKKRKRASEKATAKVKAAKKAQRLRKGKGKGKGDDSQDEDDVDDDAMWGGYEKAKPVPGQLENCVKCEKRFTVTAYSKAGPLGGLLCPKCSKEVDDEDQKAKPKKKPVARDRNRQIRSDLMDGNKQRGPKALVNLCVQKIAANINDVEEFGELPPRLLEALRRILSKKRLMNGRTLDLFLSPAYDTVKIYDAAAFTTADFKIIFAVMPGIRNLLLENAGQFKNEVLQYVTEHPSTKLVDLRLSAANLIDDEVWTEFFAVKGQYLETLKLEWIDGNLGDEIFARLIKDCPNLQRVKFEKLMKLTSKSIGQLAKLEQLKHLTIELNTSIVSCDDIESVLKALGKQLRTLCLSDFGSLESPHVAAIHETCENLNKLRITNNCNLRDEDFVRLFKGWSNPPLRYVNLSKCRHLDAGDPHLNRDNIGLCGDGFEALMAHSGQRLEHLSVTSCRHISHAAFSRVFDSVTTYPALAYVCLSFCSAVDDTILAGMFRSCPALKKVQVFACFGVKDVLVPRGVVLLGRPNAQDELAIEGDAAEVA
ncbi:MAG: hypothetical protein M1832_003235 [Thelocarpon impressellum]|nr:MAG: hypothetical protein M1832_003235 [Thelocarpon impressellum]